MSTMTITSKTVATTVAESVKEQTAQDGIKLERRNNMAKLTLVRGLPGSGKSTYANTLGCLHLDVDMYFTRNGVHHWYKEGMVAAHKWLLSTTAMFLSQGIDVVVSNCFIEKAEMEPYINLGYETRVVVMRGMFGNIHNVPEDRIAELKLRWEE